MFRHITKASKLVNTTRGTIYALSYLSHKAMEFNEKRQEQESKKKNEKPGIEIRSALVITVPSKHGAYTVIYDTKNDTFLMTKPFAAWDTHPEVTEIPLSEVFKAVLRDELLPQEVYMRIPAFRKMYKNLQDRLQIKMDKDQIIYTMPPQEAK